MKANYDKVRNLTDSYLNGNKSSVRGKAKRLNKVEFVLLCAEIEGLTDNKNIDQIAFDLTLEG